MENFKVDSNGFYGEFGGAYIPEILYDNVEDLKNAYLQVLDDPAFQKEYHDLLKDYVGRPSPLYLAKRLSEKYGCKIYLKREDLNHTGAHKINNTIGQILLARRMGKTRIIAETGAGQHGVATAISNCSIDLANTSRGPTVVNNVEPAGTSITICLVSILLSIIFSISTLKYIY